MTNAERAIRRRERLAQMERELTDALSSILRVETIEEARKIAQMALKEDVE